MGKIKDKAISSSIPNTFDFSKMPIMMLKNKLSTNQEKSLFA